MIMKDSSTGNDRMSFGVLVFVAVVVFFVGYAFGSQSVGRLECEVSAYSEQVDEVNTKLDEQNDKIQSLWNSASSSTSEELAFEIEDLDQIDMLGEPDCEESY